MAVTHLLAGLAALAIGGAEPGETGRADPRETAEDQWRLADDDDDDDDGNDDDGGDDDGDDDDGDD